MNLNTTALLAKLSHVTDGAKRYRVIIFALFFLGLYGYLIMQISSLINSEPPQTVVTDKAQTIKRIRVDQKSIDSLLELEEENIEVKTLFQEARENPFVE